MVQSTARLGHGAGTPRVGTGGPLPRRVPGACLLVGMQGILVLLVPILIAGFALLMDRVENAILAEPEEDAAGGPA